MGRAVILVGYSAGGCTAHAVAKRLDGQPAGLVLIDMPDGEEWRASWPLADRTADIPGNHLELLDEHARSTAAAIRSWAPVIA